MPDRCAFYNPVDRWSTTVEQARLHADFHAVDEPPEYDHYDVDDGEGVLCPSCDTVLDLDEDLVEVPDEHAGEGATMEICVFCEAEYIQL